MSPRSLRCACCFYNTDKCPLQKQGFPSQPPQRTGRRLASPHGQRPPREERPPRANRSARAGGYLQAAGGGLRSRAANGGRAAEGRRALIGRVPGSLSGRCKRRHVGAARGRGQVSGREGRERARSLSASVASAGVCLDRPRRPRCVRSLRAMRGRVSPRRPGAVMGAAVGAPGVWNKRGGGGEILLKAGL